jgi:hypothetical protein
MRSCPCFSKKCRKASRISFRLYGLRVGGLPMNVRVAHPSVFDSPQVGWSGFCVQ